jgi:mannosyltransferase
VGHDADGRLAAPSAETLPVPRWALAGLGALALAAGVVLRFWATSPLWLDEALTVNIASLPLARLPEALRHDGAPPLYFALLHGWMGVVGGGDVAVRALSGVISLAALPAMWWAGRQLGGPRVGLVALVLTATSPFAIRYATEARMYSLLLLLGVLGLLALSRALDDPSPGSLAALAAVTALLLYTHYWAAFLAAPVALMLVAWSFRGQHRTAARRCLVALAAGGLLFAPWLPVLAWQLGHTGTPWADRAGPTALFGILAQYVGGSSAVARGLALVLAGLAGLGLCGRAVDGRRVELDLLGRPPGRALAVAFGGSVALAVAAGLVLGTGLEARYTAAAFPLVLLLAALGTRTLEPGPGPIVATVGAVVLGLTVAAGGVTLPRTQAGQAAAAIVAGGRQGDVVAFCPDQLGPAVNRLLPEGFRQLAFPDGRSPAFVDWADYAARQSGGDPAAFARHLDVVAGESSRVWLVWAGGYRGLALACERLHSELAGLGREAREVLRPTGTTRTLEASHLTGYEPA